VTENKRENCQRKHEINILTCREILVVAAACAIIAAAAVRKRRRKRRSCWVRAWMYRRPQTPQYVLVEGHH